MSVYSTPRSQRASCTCPECSSQTSCHCFATTPPTRAPPALSEILLRRASPTRRLRPGCGALRSQPPFSSYGYPHITTTRILHAVGHIHHVQRSRARHDRPHPPPCQHPMMTYGMDRHCGISRRQDWCGTDPNRTVIRLPSGSIPDARVPLSFGILDSIQYSFGILAS